MLFVPAFLFDQYTGFRLHQFFVSIRVSLDLTTENQIRRNDKNSCVSANLTGPVSNTRPCFFLSVKMQNK